jgi:hypothetical protein
MTSPQQSHLKYHHLLGLKVKGQRSENHHQGSKAKNKIVKKHLLKYKKQVKKEIVVQGVGKVV